MNIVGAHIRRRICQDEPIEPLRFYNGAASMRITGTALDCRYVQERLP